MTFIQLEAVTKRFGSNTVLDSISLSINDGERFFLLGPSGCGKTTLLRCLAGLTQPDSGAIFIGETDVTRAPAHARGTAMVFQSYALWPHMTVAENVLFGLEIQRLPKEERLRRLDEALGIVQLDKKAGSYPQQLSGGQQQRVALARALALRPKVLLLDEPLSNLDAALRHELREQLTRLHQTTGLTMVYVTHDQEEALSMADRVAVLNAGKVVALGTPRELYSKPSNRFVATFLGETNLLPVTAVESGELITIETPVGKIASASKLGSGGKNLMVSIRPESLSFEPTVESTRNQLELNVTAVQFLGGLHRITLTSGTTTLIAHTLRDAPAPGSRVPVFVSPSDVVVMEEESR